MDTSRYKVETITAPDLELIQKSAPSLALEHWRYVADTLKQHNVSREIIEKNGYYYLVGFMEGYYNSSSTGYTNLSVFNTENEDKPELLAFHFANAFDHGAKHAIEANKN